MKEQTFSEHLDELRKRLLWSLASVGVGVLAAFFIRDWLLRVIERPHRFAMKSIHLDSNLYVFRYEETFFVQLKIWLIAGFILSSPAIFFHVWRFIEEALQPKEKKMFWKYFPISFLLFALGALFGYYFLIPYGLLFLA
ncbi:MAG: twin-arginine translocase subunit TatC, partial [Deltaproteobacteria bacterium]|nr:twin-arginine translocase subunit TatC [Deltaproteobacteria bacterium]